MTSRAALLRFAPVLLATPLFACGGGSDDAPDQDVVNDAAPPGEKTANSNDPAACREVQINGELMAEIITELEGSAMPAMWTMAAERFADIEDTIIADASPELRDQVWDLIDKAAAVAKIGNWAQEDVTPRVDAVVQSLIRVNDHCTTLEYPIW